MKARAIATIVMTLFLVSIVGIASTASAKKPKPSHDRTIPGKSVEVRAELRVDPNKNAAAMGVHPVNLDILEVAILSSGIKNWKVLKDSVSIELFTGNRSINIPVQRQRRMRDLNDDGIGEYLLEIDLAHGREAHREATGYHPDTISVRYVSSVEVGSRGSGRGIHSFEVSASLFDAAMSIDDASNCMANGDNLYVVESITCTYTSSEEDMDVQQLVDTINQHIAVTDIYIPIDAQTVIEAYAGKGPGSRWTNVLCWIGECNMSTGKPGAPGYAVTAVSLNKLDKLSIYVGQNGKYNTFGAGSASLVSTKKLEDITPGNITKPGEVGIIIIAGSGGAGGGWTGGCKGRAQCHNGLAGYAGGQAPLSIDNDVSAAGHGLTGNGLDGEGGNSDGEGSGGTGAGNNTVRDGTKGIGGFGGMDQYSENYQSVFEGVDFEWPWGAGGDSEGKRGDASGGGGFGGGGGGGSSKYHKGGGGGAGSWSRQATSNPGPKLVHGANKASGPKVLITFEVVYNK